MGKIGQILEMGEIEEIGVITQNGQNCLFWQIPKKWQNTPKLPFFGKRAKMGILGKMVKNGDFGGDCEKHPMDV